MPCAVPEACKSTGHRHAERRQLAPVELEGEADRRLDREHPASDRRLRPSVSCASAFLDAVGREREAALPAQWLVTEAAAGDGVLDRREPLRTQLATR